MKLLNWHIMKNRRFVLVFLLAIFLPSLFAAYLSLNTFARRREAVGNLLESNLWISAEAALRSVEGSLLDYEQKVLRSDNLVRLLQDEKAKVADTLFPEDSAGKVFLLNTDFKIIFPETGVDTGPEIQYGMNLEKSRFGQLFSRAEDIEFTQKEYQQAAELFKESAFYAPSDKYRAIAMEGLGRCLIASEEYKEALKTYDDLLKNYSYILNKAGHPFGIVAAFQTAEIARRNREERHSLEILLSLYQKILEGTWTINQPTYDFYISEIESIFENEPALGKFPGIQKAYSELKEGPSSYRQILLFTNYLERNAIPGIKDKLSLPRLTDQGATSRFSVESGEEFSLISYVVMPDFQSGHDFYAGIYWNTEYLKNRMIPRILESFSKDSGLDFKIVNTNNVNEKGSMKSNGSLELSFHSFPFPWKLIATYPEIETIEKTTSREIFFYGILLGVIVILMLLGAVLIARDISRESETNRLKTEFVNNISHELKTPLTLIRLYGETLQHKKNLTYEEMNESYEIITKESERLSHLINNVLDFSRIDMGRKEFDFKKGNIQEVIIDTLESYKYHLEKKGFIVQTDIARDLPELNFDAEAIASVLVNLLSNAMKFSHHKKEVTVKLFRFKRNIVLQVADKGIGIPSGEVSKIFHRFYRSENKTVSDTRGSGLGLTLVKHIVEAHGGTIEVESEVGTGSTFKVILPMNDIDNDL